MTYIECFRVAHGYANEDRKLESDLQDLIDHGSPFPVEPYRVTFWRSLLNTTEDMFYHEERNRDIDAIRLYAIRELDRRGLQYVITELCTL